MALEVARRIPPPPPLPRPSPLHYGQTRFLTRFGDLVAQDPAPTSKGVISFLDAEFEQLRALSDFQSVTLNFLRLTRRRRRCTFKLAAYRFLKTWRIHRARGDESGLHIPILLWIIHAVKYIWYDAFDGFVDHGVNKEYSKSRHFVKSFVYWWWAAIRLNGLIWQPWFAVLR
jgi:hypothetical protein